VESNQAVSVRGLEEGGCAHDGDIDIVIGASPRGQDRGHGRIERNASRSSRIIIIIIFILLLLFNNDTTATRFTGCSRGQCRDSSQAISPKLERMDLGEILKKYSSRNKKGFFFFFFIICLCFFLLSLMHSPHHPDGSRISLPPPLTILGWRQVDFFSFSFSFIVLV
jgi:predicted nucleic acid-binding Zn ribbon protein